MRGTAEKPDERDEMDVLSARELAAVLPDPIVIIDVNAAARYANPAATAAFGQIPRGTLLPHKFRTPEMQQLVATVLRDRRPGAIDYAERVPIERTFRVSAMPLGGSSGLFLVHFKDQSETRRIDRMRADFIANASHELRTPLASISGFIETLRGPARDDAKARENFLQIMQAQTARMARLIDDLLSLSRLEMKTFAKPGQRVDIVQVVGSVADALGHPAWYVPSGNLTWTNILIGVLVIMYTVSGGTKAVSITQKQQMAVMMGGMILAGGFVIYLLPIKFTEALHVAGKMERLNIVNFEFNLSDRYNFWSGLTGALFLFLSYFGTDQSQVQRYLSGKSMAESRMGLIMNGFLKVPMQFIILFIGVMVFVFYQFYQPPIFFNKVQTERVMESRSRRIFSSFRLCMTASLKKRTEGSWPCWMQSMPMMRPV
jgi:hypothetical protein